MLEGEEIVTEAKLEALLTCLVSPAADDNPAAARAARATLSRCERAVQPALQRLLVKLLTSPLTANSALSEQSYALIAQVGQPGRGAGRRGCRRTHEAAQPPCRA